MAEIITRVLPPTAKNAPLTNEEVDSNFVNLNNGLAQVEALIEPTASNVALILAIALG